jgi:prevent-host-death family protein
MMETVNISEFRANLLKYLAQAKAGKELNITSHGEVLATVVPPANRAKRAKTRLKRLSKTAVVGDVVSPLGEEWDALR